jgi:PEP-CTERM motif
MWKFAKGVIALAAILNAPLTSETDAATLSDVVVVPLPSAWTMMLLGLGLAFAAYRLFSV